MLRQEATKAAAISTNADIRSKSVQRPERQTPLLNVELPRVKIEHGHRRNTVPKLPKRPLDDERRQQAEITTAADRKVRSAHPKCRRRKLQDLLPNPACPEWKAVRARHSIAVVPHRKN